MYYTFLSLLFMISPVGFIANVNNIAGDTYVSSIENTICQQRNCTLHCATGSPHDNARLTQEDTPRRFEEIFQYINAYHVRKIVLDAGHGGKDHGCHGEHSKEKHIALDIVLKLGDLIKEKFPQINVIYTRKTDIFIPLHQRAEIANRENADLFLSIHCNYVNTSSVHGTETFVMGLHTAEENLKVAKRENSVITMEDDFKRIYGGYDPDSPESHILLSMYQNAHIEQSIALADAIESHFAQQNHRHSRGVKQAGFVVLKRTTMPSVLVETGFLSNKKEESYLLSEKGKQEVAKNMALAINDYIKLYAPATLYPANDDSLYSIQIVATSRLLPENHEIYHLYPQIYALHSKDLTKYYAGPFANKTSAQEVLSKFQTNKYSDAFIVQHKGTLDGNKVH